MSSRLSRRHFLTGSLAAAGALPAILRAETKKLSPNERLHVACVGCNGMGGADMNSVHAAGAEIVALCDVFEEKAADARKKFPRAPFFADFRDMLDKVKGIDAVTIGVPDHMHAVITMAALRAGKHVYCEKPLTHTVYEARQVAETAARLKRVTQMGTQIHGSDNYRRVVELVQGQAIGPVKEVHVWCGKEKLTADARPTDTPPVPKGLHYDLWLGVAPYRPYHPSFIPFYWRRWYDFGGGILNDMACHYMDLPFWALKLKHPTRVHAEGPPPSPIGAAGADLAVRYDFPERDGLPPVTLTWYDGDKRPPQFQVLPQWNSGVLFVGTRGMLIADYSQRKLLPEKEFAGFEPPPASIPPSVGHYKEWVQACKTGGPTTCNFSYSGALTEAVLLGTVSYRSGKPITWNGPRFKIDDPVAERFLHKEYRKGWTL